MRNRLLKSRIETILTLYVVISNLSLCSLHEKCRNARQNRQVFILSRKSFSLSDKCPANLSKENNILTTKMPTVLQILILSCKRFQSVSQLLHQ